MTQTITRTTAQCGSGTSLAPQVCLHTVYGMPSHAHQLLMSTYARLWISKHVMHAGIGKTYLGGMLAAKLLLKGQAVIFEASTGTGAFTFLWWFKLGGRVCLLITMSC